jgi:hypothetical protein
MEALSIVQAGNIVQVQGQIGGIHAAVLFCTLQIFICNDFDTFDPVEFIDILIVCRMSNQSNFREEDSSAGDDLLIPER